MALSDMDTRHYITVPMPEVMRSISTDSTDVDVARGRSGSDRDTSDDPHSTVGGAGWRTIPPDAVSSTGLAEEENMVYRSMGSGVGSDMFHQQVVQQQPRPLLNVSISGTVSATKQEVVTPRTQLANNMSQRLSLDDDGNAPVCKGNGRGKGREVELPASNVDNQNGNEGEAMHQVMKRCLSEGEMDNQEHAPMLVEYGAGTSAALRIACCTGLDGETRSSYGTGGTQSGASRKSGADNKAGSGGGVCGSLWSTVVGSICGTR
jgi:hypothetical protein